MNLTDYQNIYNVQYDTKSEELYMRIDIALPDFKNYFQPTILEIEPFASGRLKYIIIKDCVDKEGKYASVSHHLLSKIIELNSWKFVQ